MVNINKILDNLKELTYQNELKGHCYSEILKGLWKDAPLFINFVSFEEDIRANIGQEPIHIKVDDAAKKIISPNVSLLWITDYNVSNGDVTLAFLNTASVKRYVESIDLAITDKFIAKQISGNKNFDIQKWVDDAKDKVVYNDKESKQNILLIEEFSNNPNAFRIRSSNRALDIKIRDGKWIVETEITTKKLPRKIGEFSKFSICLYPKVNFKEYTKAGEAMRFLQQQNVQGTTILSLWDRYTELEVQKAREFQSTFGTIKFKYIKSFADRITRVELLLSAEQKDKFYAAKEDLANMSLELETTDSEVFGQRKKIFRIYQFVHDQIVDLVDNAYEIQKDGNFIISTIGDETIKKRRSYAFKAITEPSNDVIRNLYFAIEGQQDSMTKGTHHHTALTVRTRKFLQDNFGISDLNDSQKKAIEIALNTPDVAVIQGPPGTGKSTVIAAICDRLQEISEKEKDENISHDKLILISAFQNDTVEHISSKVKTKGLPTLKVGKEVIGKKAETEYMESEDKYITTQLQLLPPTAFNSLSTQLEGIYSIYQKENNREETIQRINELLRLLPDELRLDWSNHFEICQNVASDKVEKRLRALITDPQKFFIDGGRSALRRLLVEESFTCTEEERDWLDMETPQSPDEENIDIFFQRLKEFKEKYLRPYNSQHIHENKDDGFIIEWFEKAIRESLQKEADLFEDKNVFIATTLQAVQKELNSSPKYIRASIAKYSDGLAATNQVAGSMEMSSYPSIQNVILEEAARSNPLDLLIPMVKATERVILVGDHKQLPHLLEDEIVQELTEQSTNIEQKNQSNATLHESLFGRIFENLLSASPKRTITLNEQFRMHPFIGDFISKTYYDGILTSSNGIEEKKQHHLNVPWAKGKVAVFANVGNNKGAEKKGKSKSRAAEAIRTFELLKDIMSDPASKSLSIGIITFYSNQVTELCEQAVKFGYMERSTGGDYIIRTKYQYTADGREKLRIGSVDSFQGKEFDIVILNTVRSNKISHEDWQKAYGFLSLENRLNVAFSRAQKLLIVVGDGNMFNDEGAQEHVQGLYEFYSNLSIDPKYGNRI